jgi:hypothetical protein
MMNLEIKNNMDLLRLEYDQLPLYRKAAPPKKSDTSPKLKNPRNNAFSRYNTTKNKELYESKAAKYVKQFNKLKEKNNKFALQSVKQMETQFRKTCKQNSIKHKGINDIFDAEEQIILVSLLLSDKLMEKTMNSIEKAFQGLETPKIVEEQKPNPPSRLKQEKSEEKDKCTIVNPNKRFRKEQCESWCTENTKLIVNSDKWKKCVNGD